MKSYTTLGRFIAGLLIVAASYSCIETDELVTPVAASPVLVVLNGTSFEASAPVVVEGRFFELDKSGILDHTVGIDSIPVAGLPVRVFVNHSTEVGGATTDGNGRLVFEQPWAALGIATPRVGNTVRLEFVGRHKEISFRTFHTVVVR